MAYGGISIIKMLEMHSKQTIDRVNSIWLGFATKRQD